MKKKCILTLSILLCFCGLQAQEKEYMYEIGVGGGLGWYYGDVNHSQMAYNPSVSLEAVFRYNVNLRWAMTIDLSTQSMKGDSKDTQNLFPDGTQSFDRQYTQLAFRPEFTFWNYGWGSDYREKHRLAPFLTAGLGFGFANGNSTGRDKNTTILTVPLGLGLKWKMAPRWDMQFTSLWAKSFSDEADGISDPYHVGTTAPMNTDWICSTNLSITFSFGERCLECHNQNW